MHILHFLGGRDFIDGFGNEDLIRGGKSLDIIHCGIASFELDNDLGLILFL